MTAPAIFIHLKIIQSLWFTKIILFSAQKNMARRVMAFSALSQELTLLTDGVTNVGRATRRTPRKQFESARKELTAISVGYNSLWQTFSHLKNPSIMTNEQAIAFFRKSGVRFLNEMPEGWGIIKGATTAPIGYRWIGNRESLFSGKYEHALLKVN